MFDERLTEEGVLEINKAFVVWRLVGTHLFGLEPDDVERFIERQRPWMKSTLFLHERPQYYLIASIIPIARECMIFGMRKSRLQGEIDLAIEFEVIEHDFTATGFDWDAANRRIGGRVPAYAALKKSFCIPTIGPNNEFVWEHEPPPEDPWPCG